MNKEITNNKMKTGNKEQQLYVFIVFIIFHFSFVLFVCIGLRICFIVVLLLFFKLLLFYFLVVIITLFFQFLIYYFVVPPLLLPLPPILPPVPLRRLPPPFDYSIHISTVLRTRPGGMRASVYKI